MDVARRLKVGLAALVALMGSAFFAAPALADTQPDPTESNIPYLAWRGEQVRLVKCAPAITGVNQRADFLLVDWSGEENSLAIPQMEGWHRRLLRRHRRDHLGQGCVGATFSSQKAGIGQIKLVVSQLAGRHRLDRRTSRRASASCPAATSSAWPARPSSSTTSWPAG